MQKELKSDQFCQPLTTSQKLWAICIELSVSSCGTTRRRQIIGSHFSYMPALWGGRHSAGFANLRRCTWLRAQPNSNLPAWSFAGVMMLRLAEERSLQLPSKNFRGTQSSIVPNSAATAEPGGLQLSLSECLVLKKANTYTRGSRNGSEICEFPKCEALFERPYDKDHSIFGIYFGARYLWKLPYVTRQKGL